jgi:hypothetical protein
MADSDFQLTNPQVGTGLYRPQYDSLLGDYHLTLDPSLFTIDGPLLGVIQSQPDQPPKLDLTPVFAAAPYTLPPLWSPLWSQTSPATSPPSWKVPNPDPRPGNLSDLLDAVLGLPEAKQARDRLESVGQAQLVRLWSDMRANPESFALAAPLVLGIGFTGYIAGKRYDLPLLSIPSIPLPLPGLSLQLKYDNTSRGLLTDPLHPKEVGATINFDVTKLVRALK